MVLLKDHWTIYCLWFYYKTGLFTLWFYYKTIGPFIVLPFDHFYVSDDRDHDTLFVQH